LIDSHIEDIKQSFENRADSDGLVNAETAAELVMDIGTIISYDMETIMSYFRVENEDVPEGYDLK